MKRREAEVPIISGTSDRSRESSDLDRVGASHYTAPART